MMLAGTFSEYPLSLLLDILQHKRETGLLEFSSAEQSGYFYFKNGEIKDGEVGKLKGATAAEFTETFVDASFQFRQLGPTDYAQLVWEKSFGPSNVVADNSFLRRTFASTTAVNVEFSKKADAIRSIGQTVRKQVAECQLSLRSFLETILESARAINPHGASAGVWRYSATLCQIFAVSNTATQKIRFYLSVTRRNVETFTVSIVQRANRYATSASESVKKVQPRRDRKHGFQRVQAAWQAGVRLIVDDASALNFHTTSTLQRERPATLPSPDQVALSQGTMQQLQFHPAVAGSNLAKNKISTTGRANDPVMLAAQFSRGLQTSEDWSLLIRQVVADWRITLHSYWEIVSHKTHALGSQGTSLVRRQRAATLASLQVARTSLARQQLRLFASANRSLKTIEGSVARQMSTAAAALELRRVQIRTELLPRFRMALAEEWEFALLRIRSINLRRVHTLTFQRARSLVSKRAAMLPSLKQVAQSNLSFGAIIVVLLALSTLIIIEILRSDQPPINTNASEANIDQARTRQRSKENRGKRKRPGRQLPIRK